MIAVLGGGISGLTAAYQLKKQQIPFILLEASDRLGGKVASFQEAGFTCENGPNTVLINNAEIKSLIEDLGLWNSLIFPDEVAIKSRFVLKNGKIEAIPNSFKTALKSKLFSFKTLFSILKEPTISAKNDGKEESLADFSRRRFGTQIFDDFITPFVTGIYAGDPEKMSIDYTLSILKEAELEYGSVVKGMMKKMKAKKLVNDAAGLPKQKVFSFKNGLQDLIAALEKPLLNEVKTNTKVSAIKKINDQYSISYLENDVEKQVSVDAVISSLPSFSLAEVAQFEAPELTNQLQSIHYTNAVVLHLGFSKKDVGFNTSAFGILSRKAETVPFLGILFNSRFFPHTSDDPTKELVTVICGGSRYPELIHKTDEEIKDEILNSLTSVLDLKSTPIFSRITRWNNGIPQYEMGYSKVDRALKAFEADHPNFHLLGNYYNGISVSDCIKNAIHLTSNLS